ncbi:MAG: magnesium and cobalt exporter, family [Actinomycetota bacterium]|nr:magnesium and cobalt exporter, family [Actinomycetota bacterium]
MSRDVLLIAFAVLLILFGGLFAGAEAALSRVSRVTADEMERQGRRGATRLQQVVADPARYLNLLTLLRVACELVATVLVTVVCIDIFDTTWQAVLVAGVVMVVVSYIAVGVSPRTIGRQHAASVALVGARFVTPLARVLGPLPQLLILVGNALTPGKGFRDGPFASEAELRDLVDLAEENKLIEDRERMMIHSVFELGDTIAREVMVPRTDVVFIERDKTLRQAISLALRSGFSRIPVVGQGTDDVLGVAYLKDLIRRTYEYRDGESTEKVESVMRPAVFVPESKPVDELLREMQAQQTHIAIVVDEYGGTAGLVTIEDVIEEIVGEITDEYDLEEVPDVQELDGRRLRVSARLPVEDLAELFPGADGEDSPLNEVIEAADVDTVGGLLAQQLGKVPLPGATTEVAGLRLLAEGGKDARGRIRITSVLVDPIEPDHENDDRDDNGENPVERREEKSDVRG